MTPLSQFLRIIIMLYFTKEKRFHILLRNSYIKRRKTYLVTNIQTNTKLFIFLKNVHVRHINFKVIHIYIDIKYIYIGKTLY